MTGFGSASTGGQGTGSGSAMGTERPVVDAKSVVLLVKNPFLFTRCDHDNWVLEHIMRPLEFEDVNRSSSNIQVLEVATEHVQLAPFHLINTPTATSTTTTTTATTTTTFTSTAKRKAKSSSEIVKEGKIYPPTAEGATATPSSGAPRTTHITSSEAAFAGGLDAKYSAAEVDSESSTSLPTSEGAVVSVSFSGEGTNGVRVCDDTGLESGTEVVEDDDDRRRDEGVGTVRAGFRDEADEDDGNRSGDMGVEARDGEGNVSSSVTEGDSNDDMAMKRGHEDGQTEVTAPSPLPQEAHPYTRDQQEEPSLKAHMEEHGEGQKVGRDGHEPRRAPNERDQHEQQQDEQEQQKQEQRLFRITPETRVYTFAQKYRMVFLIDVSPSMTTVTATAKPKFNPEIYITVLAECGNMLFYGDRYTETSSFARDKHPVRVLMHQVRIVHPQNVHEFAEKLYDALNAYELELVAARRADRLRAVERAAAQAEAMRRRRKEGGPMFTVGGGADNGDQVDDDESEAAPSASAASSASHAAEATATATKGGNIYNSLEHALFSLSLLPRDCSPAIVLITDGTATGSSSASEMIARDFCRILARDYVAFTVIQVGSPRGFKPDVNFGHVPDNEYLRFLAMAGFGRFLYASDCKYLDSGAGTGVAATSSGQGMPRYTTHHHQHSQEQQPHQTSQQQPSMSSSSSSSSASSSGLFAGMPEDLTQSFSSAVGAADTPSPVGTFPNVATAATDAGQNPAMVVELPNFYHRQLLFRDTCLKRLDSSQYDNWWQRVHVSPGGVGIGKGGGLNLERPVDLPRPRLVNAGIEPGPGANSAAAHELFSMGETRFPWDPQSVPPMVAEILCGYREYTVSPQALQHLVSTRLLEGYALRSIHVTQKPGRPAKVVTILAMPWLPYITIYYTIKSTWTAPEKPVLSSEGMAESGGKRTTGAPARQAGPGESPMGLGAQQSPQGSSTHRHHRHYHAHHHHHHHSKPPRIALNILAHHTIAMLFINIQNLEQTKNPLFARNKVHEKILKLHGYLRGVYETDDLFRVVASFNSKAALASVPMAPPGGVVPPPSTLTTGSGSSPSSSSSSDGHKWMQFPPAIITSQHQLRRQQSLRRQQQQQQPSQRVYHQSNVSGDGVAGTRSRSPSPSSRGTGSGSSPGGQAMYKTQQQQQIDNVWGVLHQIISTKTLSFDEWTCDIILRSTSPASHVTGTIPRGAGGVSSSAMDVGRSGASDVGPPSATSTMPGSNAALDGLIKWSADGPRSRRQVAMIYLLNYLAKSWSTFSIGKTVFVKLVYPDDYADDENDDAAEADFAQQRDVGSGFAPGVPGSIPEDAGGVGGTSSRRIGSDIPSGFCFMRITSENDFVLTLRASFFNMDLKRRRCMVEELMRDVADLKHVSQNTGYYPLYPVVVCRKPTRQLMIRYRPKREEQSQQQTTPASPIQPRQQRQRRPSSQRKQQVETRPALSSSSNSNLSTSAGRNGAEARFPNLKTTAPQNNRAPSPPPMRTSLSNATINTSTASQRRYKMQLISNGILRSFLRHHKWIWLSDVDDDQLEGDLLLGTDRVPIHELAFQLLYHNRLEEGFVPISEFPGSVTLYREVTFSPDGGVCSSTTSVEDPCVCSIQFVLMKDQQSSNIVTEIWCEPLLLRSWAAPGAGDPLTTMDDGYSCNTLMVPEYFDVVAAEMVEKDRQLIDRLYTFDRIHFIGRSGGGYISSSSQSALISDSLHNIEGEVPKTDGAQYSFDKNGRPPRASAPSRSSSGPWLHDSTPPFSLADPVKEESVKMETTMRTQCSLPYVMYDSAFVTALYGFPVSMSAADSKESKVSNSSAVQTFPPADIEAETGEAPSLSDSIESGAKDLTMDRSQFASSATSVPLGNPETSTAAPAPLASSQNPAADLRAPAPVDISASVVPALKMTPAARWHSNNIILHQFFVRMLCMITDGEIPMDETGIEPTNATQVKFRPSNMASSLCTPDGFGATGVVDPTAALRTTATMDVSDYHSPDANQDLLLQLKIILDGYFAEEQQKQSGIEVGLEDAARFLMRGSRNSRCFVKIRDSSNFLLIFIPKYPTTSVTNGQQRQGPLQIAGEPSESEGLMSDSDESDSDSIRNVDSPSTPFFTPASSMNFPAWTPVQSVGGGSSMDKEGNRFETPSLGTTASLNSKMYSKAPAPSGLGYATPISSFSSGRPSTPRTESMQNLLPPPPLPRPESSTVKAETPPLLKYLAVSLIECDRSAVPPVGPLLHGFQPFETVFHQEGAAGPDHEVRYTVMSLAEQQCRRRKSAMSPVDEEQAERDGESTTSVGPEEDALDAGRERETSTTLGRDEESQTQKGASNRHVHEDAKSTLEEPLIPDGWVMVQGIASKSKEIKRDGPDPLYSSGLMGISESDKVDSATIFGLGVPKSSLVSFVNEPSSVLFERRKGVVPGYGYGYESSHLDERRGSVFSLRRGSSPSVSPATGNSLPQTPRSTHQDQSASVLSTYGQSFLSAVNGAFGIALSKAIYALLLDGQHLEKQDFHRALSSCVETSINIDLTEYLNVETLINRHGALSKTPRGGPEGRETVPGLTSSAFSYSIPVTSALTVVQKKFQAVLQKYFEPVGPYIKDRSNIYFYRPFSSSGAPSAPNLSAIPSQLPVSSVTGADATEPQQIGVEQELMRVLQPFLQTIEWADTPLFIRTQIVFVDENGKTISTSTDNVDDIESPDRNERGDLALDGFPATSTLSKENQTTTAIVADTLCVPMYVLPNSYVVVREPLQPTASRKWKLRGEHQAVDVVLDSMTSSESRTSNEAPKHKKPQEAAGVEETSGDKNSPKISIVEDVGDTMLDDNEGYVDVHNAAVTGENIAAASEMGEIADEKDGNEVVQIHGAAPANAPGEKTLHILDKSEEEFWSDLGPRTIGTAGNPIESVGGVRAILQLVCLTLPTMSDGMMSEGAEPFSYLLKPRTTNIGPSWNPIHLGRNDSDDSQRFIDEHTTLSLLPLEKRNALQETAKSIQFFLQGEIMHGLLRLPPITETTLHFMISVLKSQYTLSNGTELIALTPTSGTASDQPSPFSELGRGGASGKTAEVPRSVPKKASKPSNIPHPPPPPLPLRRSSVLSTKTTVSTWTLNYEPSSTSLIMSIPLHFVRGHHSGVEMFENEFCNAELGDFKIVRVGKFFYVYEQIERNATSGQATNVEEADSRSSASETARAQSSGLGISGASTTCPANAQEPSSNVPTFWLVLVVEGSTAMLYFFSKILTNVERSFIIQLVRKAVTQCCERINRLALLHELNETHSASEYLIASLDSTIDGRSDSSPSDSSEEEGTETHPNLALNNIIMALHALAITNRKHMLVFGSKESVFYMQFSIQEIEPESAGVESLPTPSPIVTSTAQQQQYQLIADDDSQHGPKSSTDTGDKLEKIGPLFTADSPRIPSSPSMRRLTLSTIPSQLTAESRRSSENVLVLEVFGIDNPSRDVTHEFVSLVESKLNALIQHVLGTYIARNVTIKLTSADVDFILPTVKPPNRREFYRLPAAVHSPYLYLLYLRQNLLSYLHVLSGGDVSSALRRHYDADYGWSQLDVTNRRNNQTYEIQLGEMAFLYNCIPSRNPTALEAALGQGIACICVALLDSEGRVVLEVPAEGPQGKEVNPAIHQEIASGIFSGKFLTEEEYKQSIIIGTGESTVVVEVWIQGSIALDNLFDILSVSFQDTLTDYLVEAAVGNLNMEVTRSSASRSATQDKPIAESNLMPLEPTGSVACSSSETVPSSSKPTKERQRLVDGFNDFIETSSRILKQAAESQDPAVQELTSDVRLPPWIIEEFAAEVRDLLVENSPLFTPIMAKRVSNLDVNSFEGAQSSEHFSYEIFNPARRRDSGAGSDSKRTKTGAETRAESNKGSTSEASSQSDLFAIVVGLRELNNRYGFSRYSFNARGERKGSFDSDSSSGVGLFHVRKPSGDDSVSDTTLSISSHPRRSSRVYAPTIGTSWIRSPMDDVMFYPGLLHQANVELGYRNCFLLMLLSNSRVSMFTYNFNRTHYDQVFGQLLRILSWNNIRMQFLDREFPFTLAVTSSRLGSSGFGVTGTTSSVLASSFGGSKTLATYTRRPSSMGSNRSSASPESKLRVDLPRQNEQRQLYDMSTDVLQTRAVEFLDWYVRQLNNATRSPRPNRVGMPIGGSASQDPSSKSGTGAPRSKYGRPDNNPPSPASRHIFVEIVDKQSDSYQQEKHGASGEKVAAPSASNLASILRSVRLLHFARYPLLFTELREQILRSSFDPYGTSFGDSEEGSFDEEDSNKEDSNSASDDDVVASSWYRSMVKAFIRDYVAYLCHLGMEVVQYESEEIVGSGASSVGKFVSRYTASDRVSVDTDTVYLRCVLDGGVIIIQVGVEGMFACVNLYTLTYSKSVETNEGEGESQSSSGGSDERMRRMSGEAESNFVRECDKWKRWIHLNSFCYDFHLRYFQNCLERMSSDFPSLDLLSIMQTFVTYNTKRSNFARCRIVHGAHSPSGVRNISMSLLRYILKNPERYGFESVLRKGGPTACFTTSQSADFGALRNWQDSQAGGGGAVVGSMSQFNYTFTIVVYPSSEEPQDEAQQHLPKLSSSTAAIPIGSASMTSASTLNNNTAFSGRRSPISPKPKDVRTSPTKQDRPAAPGLSTTTTPTAPAASSSLRYFLIILDRRDPFPVREAERSPFGAMEPEADPFQEYLCDGYYLGDVVRYAGQRIDNLVDQAVRFYGRDSLWRQLAMSSSRRGSVEGPNSQRSNLSVPSTQGPENADDEVLPILSNPALMNGQPGASSEWTKMFLEKIAPNSRPLLAMDPDLANLMCEPQIPWVEVFEFLKVRYDGWARELYERDEYVVGSGVGVAAGAVKETVQRQQQQHQQPARPAPYGSSFHAKKDFPSAGISVDTSASSSGYHPARLPPSAARPQQRRRHLIIFNPRNQDYLIHFVLWNKPEDEHYQQDDGTGSYFVDMPPAPTAGGGSGVAGLGGSSRRSSNTFSTSGLGGTQQQPPSRGGGSIFNLFGNSGSNNTGSSSAPASTTTTPTMATGAVGGITSGVSAAFVGATNTATSTTPTTMGVTGVSSGTPPIRLSSVFSSPSMVEAFAVSREGIPDEIEYEHVSEVVRTISCWLWGKVMMEGMM
ncbi:hypothetical protein HK102_001446 [Quaeritorhiza haematococci]|nr:hypothetical protein HK102_001446 [Quaeritorhiza haematococci]